MNLILFGLPASGKTHFGKMVAAQLGWPFIDTDLLIETSFKEATDNAWTCRQIVLNTGMPFFREWEQQVIGNLILGNQQVIATGGGALLNPENAKKLKSFGTLIYLKAPIPLLLERMMRKPEIPSYLEPLNPEGSFEKLAKERQGVYESYADHIIDTARLHDHEVVELIASKIAGELHGK